MKHELFNAIGRPLAVKAISAYTRAMIRTARPSAVLREMILMSSDDLRELNSQPTKFRQLRFVLGRIRRREVRGS